MRRALYPAGAMTMGMGAALLFPVIVARNEQGTWSEPGIGVAAAGIGLLLAGAVAARAGFRSRTPMPSGVRVVVIANALALAFLALELSDRIARQDGRLAYWTTFLLPPALLLCYGLLTARSWGGGPAAPRRRLGCSGFSDSWS
jgi:hypothetical protein